MAKVGEGWRGQVLGEPQGEHRGVSGVAVAGGNDKNMDVFSSWYTIERDHVIDTKAPEAFSSRGINLSDILVFRLC